MNKAISGDDVRIAYPLFNQAEGGGSTPTSPLQLEITELDIQRARMLNALWHSRLPIYETGFCLNSTVSYGALFQNRYYAVAIWTNPVARNLPQRSWLELRRMAIAPDAPRYTASRMLSIMAKLIRVNLPDVTTLISYQDIEVHKGIIYKAAGWVQAPRRHRGGSWNRPNSKNTSNGKPRIRPDLNQAIGAKIRWQKEIRAS
jgi:hypothetical protein